MGIQFYMKGWKAQRWVEKQRTLILIKGFELLLNYRGDAMSLSTFATSKKLIVVMHNAFFVVLQLLVNRRFL